jgi:integrase
LNPRSSLIFPLVDPTGKMRQISQGAVSDALRKLRKVDAKGRRIVAHGFRSTFRVWTIEVTQARREVCELALAHGESNAPVTAYTRRADPFNDRVRLMKQWADYVLPPSAGAEGS